MGKRRKKDNTEANMPEAEAVKEKENTQERVDDAHPQEGGNNPKTVRHPKAAKGL